jgi:cell division protein FtsI (penicillin-binding protein 3)
MAEWKNPFARANPSGREGGNAVFHPQKSAVQTRRVRVQASRGFANARENPDVVQGQYFRAILVMIGIILVFAGIGGRLAFVALMPPAEPRASIREMPAEPLRRGNIYDRNEVLLAATLQVYSLYADPKRVIDKDEVVRRLPSALPDVDMTRLKAQLNDPSRRFIWIKRRLTPEEAAKVNALGLPGLEFRDEFVRIYPHRELASHVLGSVDVDNNGLAGVERAFDAQLKKGEDVHLAIDVRLQEMLRARIADVVSQTQAKAGWGLVMKAPTREVVALVSLPDFDPNHYGDATPEQRFNHVTLGSYEMGSTFKLFTLAQGLDEGKVTPDTQIDCRTPITIGRYKIGDMHGKHSFLSAEEVLRYSSNIGAAKIADMSGPEAQKVFMQKMGMLEPINIGISEVGPVRYPSNWGRIQTFTIAFGHGMSVTPVHMVNAVAALSDGFLRPATLLKGGSSASKPQPSSPYGKRVVSDATLVSLHRLMRDVVLNGSGRPSQVVGYDIGGKTGTAEKISGRGYDKEKSLVSFIGVMPVRNPEYIALVMVDEPKGHQYDTGGKVSAPVVGGFFRDLTQIMGVMPDMSEIQDYKAMLAKYRRKETDPWAVYTLSDFRQRRAQAAGVAIDRTVAGAAAAHD